MEARDRGRWGLLDEPVAARSDAELGAMGMPDGVDSAVERLAELAEGRCSSSPWGQDAFRAHSRSHGPVWEKAEG